MRDSVYLTPVEEEGGLNHQTGPPYRHALFSQDSYEYYPGPQSQNGSSHSANAPEQDEAESGFEKRGVGLDFAILDSTFLLSQVFPTLFMGMIVQFAQSVTAYIACSAIFGAVAIYLASQIVFDQKDLRNWVMGSPIINPSGSTSGTRCTTVPRKPFASNIFLLSATLCIKVYLLACGVWNWLTEDKVRSRLPCYSRNYLLPEESPPAQVRWGTVCTETYWIQQTCLFKTVTA